MQRRILHRVHVILTQYEVTWMIQPFSLTQNEGAGTIASVTYFCIYQKIHLDFLFFHDKS